MGFETTVQYLAHIAGRVMEETGLIPHVNPGVLTRDEIGLLRKVSASQGLMLEQTSTRLFQRGQAQWARPDKQPPARLQTIRLACELKVPFTTGLLIGIGETLKERAETIARLAAVADGEHVQEL